MPAADQQITYTILAVTVILLFFGVLFLVMLIYYNYRRRQTAAEKKEMRAQFDAQLMQARLEMQEQAFNRISEEIHDNVGQLLSLTKMQLSQLDESDILDREILTETRENVAHAIRDLRNLAKSLNTSHIGSLSITKAAEEEGMRINRAGKIAVSVTSEGPEKPLSEERHIIIFRIIQECLQNCVKHAEASFVNIGFTWYPDQLRVRVRDDGKGFDAETALQNSSGGLGLQNIRNRARLTGGAGVISSAPGEGTTVTVMMPYE